MEATKQKDVAYKHVNGEGAYSSKFTFHQVGKVGSTKILIGA